MGLVFSDLNRTSFLRSQEPGGGEDLFTPPLPPLSRSFSAHAPPPRPHEVVCASLIVFLPHIILNSFILVSTLEMPFSAFQDHVYNSEERLYFSA